MEPICSFMMGSHFPPAVNLETVPRSWPADERVSQKTGLTFSLLSRHY